jgi:hypothetical protein
MTAKPKDKILINTSLGPNSILHSEDMLREKESSEETFEARNIL